MSIWSRIIHMQRSRPVTDRQTDRPEGKQGKRKDADNMKSRQKEQKQADDTGADSSWYR